MKTIFGERGRFDLAETFVAEGFRLRPVLRQIFLSEAFREGSYRALIKNPLDYVVGAARNLEAEVDARLLLFSSNAMGLTPLNPPTPAGRPAGSGGLRAAAGGSAAGGVRPGGVAGGGEGG